MNSQKEITYINNISVEDYNALRKSVNWINVTEKRAAIALKNSFYLCVAVCDGKPVGMARIVSDGGYTYFITDVIVHPDYQGYHIGTELIRRELDYIQKDVVAGETVMVSLMAAYHRESFYEKFGFHTRPFGNHWSRNVNVGFQRCHRKSYDFLKIPHYGNVIPIQTYSFPNYIGNQSLQVCSQVYLYQCPMFYTTHQDLDKNP